MVLVSCLEEGFHIFLDVLYRNSGISNISFDQWVELYRSSTNIDDTDDAVSVEHVAILREDESAEGVVDNHNGLIF